MPRLPGLWFRESNGFYYSTIDGVQHKLHPDKKMVEGTGDSRLRAAAQALGGGANLFHEARADSPGGLLRRAAPSALTWEETPAQ